MLGGAQPELGFEPEPEAHETRVLGVLRQGLVQASKPGDNTHRLRTYSDRAQKSSWFWALKGERYRDTEPLSCGMRLLRAGVKSWTS